jgi:hypothetical protein
MPKEFKPMALKVTVDTLDDVPEPFRTEYTESNGKFILNVEGVDDHPDVVNLKSAYTRVKESDKAKAEQLRDALAKLEAKPNPTAKDDAAILQLRQQLEAERDGYKTKAEQLEGQVYKLTVESQLDEAIRGVGIQEAAFAKAAKVMLQGAVKVADGKPFFETDMGPVALSDYVKRWASSEGAAFVSAPKGGGAGGGKGGGSNPKPTGNLSGSRDERKAALKQRFPDLD